MKQTILLFGILVWSSSVYMQMYLFINSAVPNGALLFF